MTKILRIGILLMLVSVLSSDGTAQTFKVLYEFQGNTDGGSPNDLIRDAAGNLYGTTIAGGKTIFGTVFKIDTSGTKTILYNFSGGTDGTEPHGSLLADSQGNLYGTTEYGGDLSVLCEGMQGCGVVFKIDPAGHETVLYRFTGGADGGQPMAGLILDDVGNLYGTTAGGGKMGCNYIALGCGVVFKVDPSGKETVLYSFMGGYDGGDPQSPLIRDPSGNLYGMTTGVGAGSGGTVFKLDTSGTETVLHAFTGGKDGSQPYGSLVRDRAGNVYGTTYGGGTGDPNNCNQYGGCGIVFKVSPQGKEMVLNSFDGEPGGWGSVAGLVRDNLGNFYGTAALGGLGPNCCGVVFALNSKRQETVLHTFSGGLDGGSPETRLTIDKSGNLYGTTLLGTYGYGVAFTITPPNFKIKVSPAKSTLLPGGSVNSTLTISPIGNLVGVVTLSCAVPSGDGLGCEVLPVSLSLRCVNSSV